jgi:hypothetical protein
MWLCWCDCAQGRQRQIAPAISGCGCGFSASRLLVQAHQRQLHACQAGIAEGKGGAIEPYTRRPGRLRRQLERHQHSMLCCSGAALKRKDGAVIRHPPTGRIYAHSGSHLDCLLHCHDLNTTARKSAARSGKLLRRPSGSACSSSYSSAADVCSRGRGSAMQMSTVSCAVQIGHRDCKSLTNS